MARENSEMQAATEALNFFNACATARTQADHLAVGKKTELTQLLRDLLPVADFQAHQALKAFSATPEVKAKIEALAKARVDANAKAAAEFKAKGPSKNAPYHRPRAGQVPVTTPPGTRTEQL